MIMMIVLAPYAAWIVVELTSQLFSVGQLWSMIKLSRKVVAICHLNIDNIILS